MIPANSLSGLVSGGGDVGDGGGGDGGGGGGGGRGGGGGDGRFVSPEMLTVWCSPLHHSIAPYISIDLGPALCGLVQLPDLLSS